MDRMKRQVVAIVGRGTASFRNWGCSQHAWKGWMAIAPRSCAGSGGTALRRGLARAVLPSVWEQARPGRCNLCCSPGAQPLGPIGIQGRLRASAGSTAESSATSSAAALARAGHLSRSSTSLRACRGQCRHSQDAWTGPRLSSRTSCVSLRQPVWLMPAGSPSGHSGCGGCQVLPRCFSCALTTAHNSVCLG